MSRKNNSFSYSQSELHDISQDILAYAASRGASACETDISEGFGQTVTVRCGNLETIEYNRDKGIGVTVYQGQQRGHASSSDFSREALHATVDAALSIASFTAPDPAAGLADEALLWRGKKMDLDLYHPWRIDTDQAAEIAQRCESAAFAVSPEIRNSDGASVYAQQSQFMAANSAGFCAGFATSRHSISVGVIAGEGDSMQTGDWYSSMRDPQELANPAAIGDYAARRALSRLGSRRIKTCEVPVIFEAPQACGLLGSFVQAVSGGSLYRKASFLMDSLGKPVFSANVHIDELPHIPKALGSTPFDDEGVATRERKLVDAGVLNGYFLGSYSARKLGMQTTGNAGGCHNLILRAGDKSLYELAREIGRGLLVTELLGQGVNYVTGDYSRGAAGYWIENGEICYPVQEITIAGNLRDMFRNIVAIGNDTIVRGGKQCPSLVIGKMTIAGE
ncbi:metalloprotease PmbA [Uliginosibacterium sp. 31-12]|uniref:metalloprotease PmbA n=1 Tax=Uliginosibacterium sp. 31-12 TaxID=3062781 RepID=UPI0026E122D0|nr:metalloprotease PmbA [Uliginosibacterium sp. 31-12]MDO6385538.1 metalloprotease PmbA [Uliginosibacterium sp. 31-12]